MMFQQPIPFDFVHNGNATNKQWAKLNRQRVGGCLRRSNVPKRPNVLSFIHVQSDSLEFKLFQLGVFGWFRVANYVIAWSTHLARSRHSMQLAVCAEMAFHIKQPLPAPFRQFRLIIHKIHHDVSQIPVVFLLRLSFAVHSHANLVMRLRNMVNMHTKWEMPFRKLKSHAMQFAAPFKCHFNLCAYLHWHYMQFDEKSTRSLHWNWNCVDYYGCTKCKLNEKMPRSRRICANFYIFHVKPSQNKQQ